MMKAFINYESIDFIPSSWQENKSSLPKNIFDKEYINFLRKKNGGYYFNNGIHIYGNSPQYSYHDLDYMNNLVKGEYGNLAKGFFFGEDVFGNLFGFLNNNVISLDIESADIKVISDNFSNWMQLVLDDLDFFTAFSITEQLSLNMIKFLAKGNRLSPKIPFVLGGEYEGGNLVLKNFEENIKFNASIAKQIYNTPDGGKFNITIQE